MPDDGSPMFEDRAYRLLRPLLFALPAEWSHRLTLRLLRALPRGDRPRSDPMLAVSRFGLRFASPIGLAAGFDKDGLVADRMFRFGFGFVEVGTVTPRPQPGNPRPRLFRLVEDEAVINRMGFNNAGAEALARRLARMRRVFACAPPGPIGVNIGANRDSADPIADYAYGLARFAPLADFLVINVSSPNTPGLRRLQEGDALARLLEAVRRWRDGPPPHPPVLLKIAPDMDEEPLSALIAAVLAAPIAGLVVSNTTIARPEGLRSPRAHEKGGLSGRPLFDPSTRLLARVYRHTGGRLPLVGAGGIASAADAYAKIRAGACLIELYSALVYRGPGLVREILRALPALLRADGFASLEEAVGADHR